MGGRTLSGRKIWKWPRILFSQARNLVQSWRYWGLWREIFRCEHFSFLTSQSNAWPSQSMFMTRNSIRAYFSIKMNSVYLIFEIDLNKKSKIKLINRSSTASQMSLFSNWFSRIHLLEVKLNLYFRKFFFQILFVSFHLLDRLPCAC